jgi:hypothetical protein
MNVDVEKGKMIENVECEKEDNTLSILWDCVAHGLQQIHTSIMFIVVVATFYKSFQNSFDLCG